MYSPRATSNQLNNMQPEPNAPVRVFLVEDMPHLQGLMVELLRSIGDFTLVGTSSTEAEAIDWLNVHRGEWDLAVVDLILEQGSGMGVLSRCRDRDRAAKVVVFSDYVTPVIHDYCISLGADAALPRSELQRFIDFCSSVARR